MNNDSGAFFMLYTQIFLGPSEQDRATIVALSQSALAYVMVKQPYIFPIVGIRKPKPLSCSITLILCSKQCSRIEMGIRVTTEKLSNESKTEVKYKSGKKFLEIKLMNIVESTSRLNGINDQFHAINKSVIQFKSNASERLTLH
ncbi:unnamed protein product [Adineta ricciae]|uniref:Uncharacterized protein n=1 Tax=Adineta ricciae TaxID=249248 RepID=A0A816D9G3_ADIRI|nr:unnamed protein product [Adineta ricciae]